MQYEQGTGGTSRKNGNSESAQITIGLILILLMIAISAFLVGVDCKIINNMNFLDYNYILIC